MAWRFYLVFVIVPLCGAPVLAYFFPETKGLSLEEIGALFGDELAVDLSHMPLEERERLDDELRRSAADVGLPEKQSAAQHLDQPKT